MIEKSIKLSKIITWYESLNGVVENYGLDVNHIINGPRSINISEDTNISFLSSKIENNIEQVLSVTNCKVIIIPKNILNSVESLISKKGKIFLLNDKPKELIVKFCRFFLEFEKPNDYENIHSTAIIEKGAKIGLNNHIGPNVFISKNSEISSNCIIGANTVIKNSKLGNFIKIGSNNTIGENGFGYNKDEFGESDFFPHNGYVIIYDNVHIGNNNCIDRGSLSDTIINKGVKIDNLVHISHNVIIGKNSFIIACSMIAGSAVIEENCWVAPSSSIRNNIKVGKNTIIGMGSVVTKNVKDNQTVLGSPAKDISEFKSFLKKK
jgi:UDP-3-O-[3-hydroxymyristoyl] glucosamine N-acyltransferase